MTFKTGHRVARNVFEHDVPFTLGVEEELLLVDSRTLAAVPAVERALAAVAGDPRFACELRPEQIEILTPVCLTVSDAARELASARARLTAALGGGVRVIGSGVHPFSARSGALTDRDRYRRLHAEYRWGCRQAHPSGLHVHVAVAGADRSLAVYNALRSYLPELAALSANSPYLDGEDTGYASIRTVLNLAFGRGGVPPRFDTWDAFAEFVRWGQRGGAWPDASYLWWHLRPNLAHGTLEVRIADAQTRVEDAAAIAGVCQALVALLARRHDAHDFPPIHDGARITENVFRACRDGMAATLLDLETGEPQPAAQRVAALLLELDAIADELGAATALEHARRLAEAEGATLQRAVAAHADVGVLARWLADETERMPESIAA